MSGRSIAIIGAFGALGRVVAREAAERGWRVAALDVAPAPPPGFATDLGAAGVALAGVDIATSEGASAALAEVGSQLGGLDALVNVAGGFAWKTTAESDLADWSRLFALNLGTTLNACRAALPLLKASGSGRIVNVGALGAVKAGAGFGPYGASKSAVHRLTEALAEETKGDGITVNAVLPSTIDTPANRRDMPKADFAKWVRPEELAAAILFLASAEASGITGALLPVTGRV